MFSLQLMQSTFRLLAGLGFYRTPISEQKERLRFGKAEFGVLAFDGQGNMKKLISILPGQSDFTDPKGERKHHSFSRGQNLRAKIRQTNQTRGAVFFGDAPAPPNDVLGTPYGNSGTPTNR